MYDYYQIVIFKAVALVMNTIRIFVMNVKIIIFWMKGSVINLINTLQTVIKHKKEEILFVTIVQSVILDMP